MNLSRGFQLSDPSIFVPWLSDNPDIERLLGGTPFRRVTRGYYTLECEPLPDLKCLIGFHTHKTGKLTELEFFRRSYEDQEASFKEFQTHFESTFGKPTGRSEGNEGFPNYEWNLEGARIIHYVYDRFGPEEHMRIQMK